MADDTGGFDRRRGRVAQWVARCDRCGAAAALDARIAAAIEDRGVSARRLEEQLRCTCGARGGSLRRWAGPVPPGRTERRVYLFSI